MPVIIPVNNVSSLLRNLALSAAEVKAMTGWPEPMIEDYLSLIRNLALLAAAVDSTVKNIVRVTTSPYSILIEDEVVFFDTDIGDISANLPTGTKGAGLRLVNVGTSGNKVTVNPFGAELLFGVNLSEYIADQEALILNYDEVEGWN